MNCSFSSKMVGSVEIWQKTFFSCGSGLENFNIYSLPSAPASFTVAVMYGFARPKRARLSALSTANSLTDREENVYPMIPAGGGQNEMILV